MWVTHLPSGSVSARCTVSVGLIPTGGPLFCGVIHSYVSDTDIAINENVAGMSLN